MPTHSVFQSSWTPMCFILVLILVLNLPSRLCQTQTPIIGNGSNFAPPSASDAFDSKLRNLTNVFERQVMKKYGFCTSNPEKDWNETLDFSHISTTLVAECILQTNFSLPQMICSEAEVKLYFNTFGGDKANINCNQTWWLSGCEAGWACSLAPGQNLTDTFDQFNKTVFPTRSDSCGPCCAGFFCPRGLACMMPCPLGAYCPIGKLNENTTLCDPYTYQLNPEDNGVKTCGSANIWADVGSSNEMFCPAGYYCPTTTQKLNCSEGSYCRKGSTNETSCLWKSLCKANSASQDIVLLGVVLIAALTIILLVLYNCSDQFLMHREKKLTDSRERAAKMATHSAVARNRWKSARDFVLKHEVELSKIDVAPEQPLGNFQASNSTSSFHREDDEGDIGDHTGDIKNISKTHVNKRKLKHVRTEMFKQAYSRMDKEITLQQDDHKISFADIVTVEIASTAKKRPKLDVAFKNLTLSIGNRKLLECVTGNICSSKIAAVMGPSGAGKTTFLNAVTGKTTGYNISGQILVNGKVGSLESYQKIIGFVPQDDIVHGNLTVEENLWFSACCRLSRDLSKVDKVVVLERVIKSLGLQDVRNSLVGTVEHRGISGGQRKRVNVGLELVMEPSLLILDEPTTGLDSSSSLLLLRALRHEALEGVNICAVVHQPSYKLFNMFDDLILLARGGLTVYHGPVDKAEYYFASLGIYIPEHKNTPEHIIDILEGLAQLSVDITPKQLPLIWMLQNGYEIPVHMQDDIKEIKVPARSYTQPIGQELEGTDHTHNDNGKSDDLNRRTAGIPIQFRYYLGRVIKQRLRESRLQAADYLILCITGICLGTIIPINDDNFGGKSYGYTIIAVSLLCQLAALRSFLPEKLQYWRERESGMSSLAYFLSRDTIDHFNTLLKPTIFLAMFYFFNNPRSTFADNYGVLVALVYCVTGIGYTFSIWFPLSIAQLCSTLVPIVFGLLTIEKGIPDFLTDLCFSKWALEAFIVAAAKRYAGVWLITRCGVLREGNYKIDDFGLCITILFLYGLFFRFIAFISLRKLK